MPVDKSNIAIQNDLACWPHLSHISLPSIDAGVELLIGANVPEALEPWQIINSQNNGPYAIKTCLDGQLMDRLSDWRSMLLKIILT